MDNEEELSLPVPGQTSFWSVHDSFRAGLRDEPRNPRSASKRREKQAAPRAQEAVQLQVRQLELKQLELQVKLKRRLEEQAKEAKEALSAKQQQIERLKQHAFLEARERQRDRSLRRTGGSRSASPLARSPRSRSFEAEELSVASEEHEARQAHRAKQVEKERERVAWRAMQEEQAEKRKTVARDEAAKKEQAARKIQAFRSASAHQRSQARAFGETRRTELKKTDKGPSQVPQKVKPKVVEREPRPPPAPARAPESPDRSGARWASNSPGGTSRSRASTPEAKPKSRKTEGHRQATETSQARLAQKSPQISQISRGKAAPGSPSSRSQSPRQPGQVPRSNGSHGRRTPSSCGNSPQRRTPSPRSKQGLVDQRPPWLPVGRSKSQQELTGREWWESNSPAHSPGPYDRDFSPQNQSRAPQRSSAPKQMEVTFGAVAGHMDPPIPRGELRLQQISRQQVDQQQTSPKDLGFSTPRVELEQEPRQADVLQMPLQDYGAAGQDRTAAPRGPPDLPSPLQAPARCQNSWWVDLQGSSVPLATPSSGASPITEPIERSLAQPQLPLPPRQLSESYSWSASPASPAPAPTVWQEHQPNAPGLGDHFAERLGLDLSHLPMQSATPAEVWQQRMRQADQLLSLRQLRSRSGSASPSRSPARGTSPFRSPAFGTSDPIIPALKIVQKYSDYFVASPSTPPSHTPRAAPPRSRSTTPRSPRKVEQRPPSPPSPPISEPRTVKAKANPKTKPSKANGVVYPRSKEVLSWQAAGFQQAGSSYRGLRDTAGVRDGWGMLNQKDGTTYAGQWVSGKRHGAGTLMFDGGIFEGQWAKGEASGSGLVRFHNGDKFEGQYISNRKHGFGVYSWADGATEEGQYFNGQKSDWHVWSKGASMWNLRYESGALVEALQVKGKKKGAQPRSLPYPRAKDSKDSKELSRQPSPRSLKTSAKVSARPKAKVAAKGKDDPFTSDLMNQLQPQQLEPPADSEQHRASPPGDAHQMF